MATSSGASATAASRVCLMFAFSDMMASVSFEKQDRIARLMRELQLFQSAARGLTSAELAERMGVSQRQAQRDIAVLESEQGVPFVNDGRRYSVMAGYWLPLVNFSITEAMTAVLPEAMRESVLEVAGALVQKTEDGTWVKVFAASHGINQAATRAGTRLSKRSSGHAAGIRFLDIQLRCKRQHCPV